MLEYLGGPYLITRVHGRGRVREGDVMEAEVAVMRGRTHRPRNAGSL